VLWADEGFGVRAVEALHEAWVFPPEVRLMDGGTLGLGLFDDIARASHVLVFDAVDCGLPGGTLKVLRGAEVPAWGAQRLSPHQNGFNDVLALAQLGGASPTTSPPSACSRSRSTISAAVCGRGPGPPAGGRGASRAGVGPLGLRTAAARARCGLRTSQRPLAGHRRLRGGPAVAGPGLPCRRPRVLALSAAPAKEQ